MDVKIMEWNINQRLNYAKEDAPEWICDYIDNNGIVVLLEIHRGNNWDKIKERAFGDRYDIFESENSKENDVLIAISKKLKLKETPVFCLSKDHSVPDFLEVKCETKNNEKFVIVGMRIHAVNIKDSEKENEFRFVLDKVKEEKNVIICGDFNNNRRGFIEDNKWNIRIIDEIIKNYDFHRKTPNGSSIYEEKKTNDAYEFAEDHFFIKGNSIQWTGLNNYSREFCNKSSSIYRWKHDFQLYLGKDELGISRYENIQPPYPDHAILSGSFSVNEICPSNVH